MELYDWLSFAVNDDSKTATITIAPVSNAEQGIYYLLVTASGVEIPFTVTIESRLDPEI